MPDLQYLTNKVQTTDGPETVMIKTALLLQDLSAILQPNASAGAVTPNNVTNLPATTKALWVGGAGAISVEIGGATVVFAAVPAGTRLPIAVTRVNATGTTATNIVALY